MPRIRDGMVYVSMRRHDFPLHPTTRCDAFSRRLTFQRAAFEDERKAFRAEFLRSTAHRSVGLSDTTHWPRRRISHDLRRRSEDALVTEVNVNAEAHEQRPASQSVKVTMYCPNDLELPEDTTSPDVDADRRDRQRCTDDDYQNNEDAAFWQHWVSHERRTRFEREETSEPVPCDTLQSETLLQVGFKIAKDKNKAVLQFDPPVYVVSNTLLDAS